MWTSLDASTLLTYIMFVFTQPGMTSTSVNKSWYNNQRKKLACSLPAYAFGIAWGILFGLISATGFLYLGPNSLGESSSLYVTSYVLFIVNVVLTKIWTPIFFAKTRSRIGLALFIAIMILLTAVAFSVMMLIDSSYLTFGLYSPYILWTCYAIFLNYKFYTFKAKRSKRTSSSSDMEMATVAGPEVKETLNGRQRRKIKPKIIV